jgi:hypothetical protein
VAWQQPNTLVNSFLHPSEHAIVIFIAASSRLHVVVVIVTHDAVATIFHLDIVTVTAQLATGEAFWRPAREAADKASASQDRLI